MNGLIRCEKSPFGHIVPGEETGRSEMVKLTIPESMDPETASSGKQEKS